MTNNNDGNNPNQNQQPNQNQGNQQQQQKPSPPRFGGSSSGSSRFGGRSNSPFARSGQQQNQGNQNQQQQQQQNNPLPRPGSRFGRFGNRELEWTITPMANTAVRFDLAGLGDPFHRLLGTELNLDYGDPKAAVKAIVEDDDLRLKLEKLLDGSWQDYEFDGAVLMYDWSEAVKKAFAVSKPVKQQQNQNNNNDDDDEIYFDDDDDEQQQAPLNLTKPPACLRAIDMTVIFNVLARVRSQVLIAGTPLALEPGFLQRSLVTDDPRLVALVRATGCIEESW